ncbi:DUF5681 domain-containing protein [Thauera sp. ZXT1-4]|uniref:DUF5681 domain-containing protein n=1 Tax=Thauera sp. ZXT1-4 TaxID=3460294 RepID=UPI0040408E80
MSERKRPPPPHAFQRGVSGNPAGKPKGTRNKIERPIVALMGQHAEAVAQRVIDEALQGDLQACRLVLERVSPAPKDRPINLPDLPSTHNVAGVSEAQQRILEAVADGGITPGEGGTLSSILESRRKALETHELEQRILALENRK